MSSKRLRSATVGWGVIVAVVLIGATVLLTWTASTPLAFLLYPVLVFGALALLGLGVLWAVRHF